MKFILLNPAGAWGLLGVPALVLIHCLRLKARELRIPAIFLVERRDEAAAGNRFARWRPSPLFWVQLAAILLLTALLLQPRLVSPQSRREVALVVDASVSMRAFRQPLLAAADRISATLSRDVATTHWLLVSTDEGAPPLYVGEDRVAMLGALEKFTPALGAHDFTAAVVTARRGLAPGGRVVLLTDHVPAEVPGGAELAAVGKPLDNAGFSGGDFPEKNRWRAMLANHGDTPVKRRWWLEFGAGQKSAPVEATLPPRGTLTLSGAVPAPAFDIVVEPDAFTPDDRLPLVVPAPKPLVWTAVLPEALAKLVVSGMTALDAQAQAKSGAKPDVLLATAKTRDLPAPGVARILFLNSEGETLKPSPEACYAPAKHPMTDGLSWGLVPSLGPATFPLLPEDVVLVRAGDRALVILGNRAGTPELVFNYDPRAVFSGEKLPAVAVLIRRFCESVRLAKDAPQALNTDCRAPLPVPPGSGALAIRDAKGVVSPAPPGVVFRAPAEPGLFAVLRGDVVKITGAAAFADTREADLTGAASDERLAAPDASREKGEIEIDPLSTLGLLLGLALILVSWRLAASRHAE